MVTLILILAVPVSAGNGHESNCNTIEVTNVVMELFVATADINVDEPIFADDYPDHVGHWIMIKLPERP